MEQMGERILDALAALGTRLEARLERVDIRLEHVDKRLEHVDRRLEHMEQRLERVEQRLAVVEERLDRVERRLDLVEQRLDRVEERLDRLEGRVDALEAGLRETRAEVADLARTVRGFPDMHFLMAAARTQIEAIAELKEIVRDHDHRLAEFFALAATAPEIQNLRDDVGSFRRGATFMSVRVRSIESRLGVETPFTDA